MSYTPSTKQPFNELCGQAERLIATHIMGWEIRKFPVDDADSFHELYFNDGNLLGFTDSYEFHPSQSIQDAFWVMDTVSTARDIRFVIDTNAKRETVVTARGFADSDYGIVGNAASTTLAVTKALLNLIQNDNPANNELYTEIDTLTEQLEAAEPETLTFHEQLGQGMIPDLNRYFPESDDINEIRRVHPQMMIE